MSDSKSATGAGLLTLSILALLPAIAVASVLDLSRTSRPKVRAQKKQAHRSEPVWVLLICQLLTVAQRND